jgi:hypothetical protein
LRHTNRICLMLVSASKENERCDDKQDRFLHKSNFNDDIKRTYREAFGSNKISIKRGIAYLSISFLLIQI